MDSPGRNRLEQTWNSPSIMEGITDSNFQGGPPDLISAAEQDLVSLPITKSDDYHGSKTYKSFLLIDSNESLCIENEELFTKKLKCQDTDRLKVVSIFGNTGDGKSHTLNQFFNSQDVFKTSNEQSSCTIGVWSAYHPELKVLFLDTEGLLGLTNNENQRMRLLLKVLAISDIVIYRTRAERLHRDLFSFLGTASMAFCKHFSAALNALGDPQSLGPAVVIFHETHNTKPLRPCLSSSVEDYLRKEITDVSLDLKAFCSLKYIGVQTTTPPTDFQQLIHTIEGELEKTEVRSPRTANVIYRALKILNSKFSGEIHDRPILLIPEQYFTCQAVCNSCTIKCERSMDHVMEGQPHSSTKNCRYQHQFDNKQLLCERCFQEGRHIVVKMTSKPSTENAWIGLASRAWYGSVIECPTCGEIFRQFKHWYGNKTPEEEAVRTQIVHVWNTDELNNGNASYSAQMLVNGVSYLSGVVANVSKKPTKSISMWMADKVAPAYWQLNSEIVICNACKKNFEQNGLKIHHCRNCGKGFCNACSKHKMPVPSRGWAEPVRVCNECKNELFQGANGEITSPHGSVQFDEDVRVRKYGEVLLNTISSVASVLEYPKDLIKDSARPDYWVPDHQATNCALCKIEFTNSPEDVVNDKAKTVHAVDQQDFYKHHCRACGQIVCNLCSLQRRPVPERGWPSDVRVCNECVTVK